MSNLSITPHSKHSKSNIKTQYGCCQHTSTKTYKWHRVTPENMDKLFSLQPVYLWSGC